MANIRRKDLDSYFSQAPGLRDEMNRLFDSFFTAPAADRSWAASWYPAIDIAETENAFTLTAELPGIKPEEVEINLAGNMLSIRGEKKEEKDEKGKNWHRVERNYGTFSRNVQLPDGIDAEKAKASYEHGLLKIEIAKSPAARPRNIKVDVR